MLPWVAWLPLRALIGLQILYTFGFILRSSYNTLGLMLGAFYNNFGLMLVVLQAASLWLLRALA